MPAIGREEPFKSCQINHLISNDCVLTRRCAGVSSIVFNRKRSNEYY